MEENIFKKVDFDYSKLIEYGFIKKGNTYIFRTTFMNDEFKAVIEINNDIVKGKVYDLNTSLEYTNIRLDIEGGFIGKIKEEYKKILLDIKDKCCQNKYFIYSQSNRVSDYIKNKYNDVPQFLWNKYPGYGVFKNAKGKWYGIIMNIDKSKIMNDSGEVEIIDVKVNENDIDKLLLNNGIYKAYHMNKKKWVSIILDDTIDDSLIFTLIDKSYFLVNE